MFMLKLYTEFKLLDQYADSFNFIFVYIKLIIYLLN